MLIPPSTSQDLRISTENNANEAALEEFRHFRPPLTPNLVVFDRPARGGKAKDTGFPWLAYYVSSGPCPSHSPEAVARPRWAEARYQSDSTVV